MDREVYREFYWFFPELFPMDREVYREKQRFFEKSKLSKLN